MITIEITVEKCVFFVMKQIFKEAQCCLIKQINIELRFCYPLMSFHSSVNEEWNEY